MLFSHVGITVIVVALTVAISLSTECLGIVLILNVMLIPLNKRGFIEGSHNYSLFFLSPMQGILFALPLAYILPGFCYIKLSWLEGEGIASLFKDKDRTAAVVLVVFGVVCAVHGVSMLFINVSGDAIRST